MRIGHTGRAAPHRHRHVGHPIDLVLVLALLLAGSANVSAATPDSGLAPPATPTVPQSTPANEPERPPGPTTLQQGTSASGTEPNSTRRQIAGPRLTWNLSYWGRSRPFTKGAEVLAQRVAERTGKRWTIVLHDRARLAKPHLNLDGLGRNNFQAAIVCDFFHPRKTQALTALSLPFLPMVTWSQNRQVREAAYAHPAIRKEFEGLGAHLYVSTFLPQYELIGSGKPLTAPADWRGRTIRAGGGIGRAAVVLRAKAANATPTEVYTDLQTGAIHAAALPATYAHVGLKLHEVASWFTTGLAPGSSDCPIAFSKTAYDALPDRYRTLLDEVRADVISAQIAAYRNNDTVNLKLLRDRLTEVRITQNERRAFADMAGRPVIDAWIKDHEAKFDARGLVEAMFKAAGETYEP